MIYHNLDFLGASITLAPVSERDFYVIFNLKESLENLYKSRSSHRYDFVVIDCLPSFGYLHLAALNTSDYVLIPVKPAANSFATSWAACASTASDSSIRVHTQYACRPS